MKQISTGNTGAWKDCGKAVSPYSSPEGGVKAHPCYSLSHCMHASDVDCPIALAQKGAVRLTVISGLKPVNSGWSATVPFWLLPLTCKTLSHGVAQAFQVYIPRGSGWWQRIDPGWGQTLPWQPELCHWQWLSSGDHVRTWSCCDHLLHQFTIDSAYSSHQPYF